MTKISSQMACGIISNGEKLVLHEGGRSLDNPEGAMISYETLVSDILKLFWP